MLQQVLPVGLGRTCPEHTSGILPDWFKRVTWHLNGQSRAWRTLASVFARISINLQVKTAFFSGKKRIRTLIRQVSWRRCWAHLRKNSRRLSTPVYRLNEWQAALILPLRPKNQTIWQTSHNAGTESDSADPSTMDQRRRHKMSHSLRHLTTTNASKERGNWIEQQQQPVKRSRDPLRNGRSLSLIFCHCFPLLSHFLFFLAFVARPGKISSSAGFPSFREPFNFLPPEKNIQIHSRAPTNSGGRHVNYGVIKPAHFQRKSSSLSFTHVNPTDINISLINYNKNSFKFNSIKINSFKNQIKYFHN